MTESIALYSFPGTNQFYQVRGQIQTTSSHEVIESSGFVFAPFEPAQSPIYFISGRPEKTTPDQCRSIEWKLNSRMVSQTEKPAYLSMFRKAIKSIESGFCAKIVLSIRETEHSPIPSVTDFLYQLRDAYPDAFIYLFYIPGEELWLGASPELLLETNHPVQSTVALAGTRKSAPELGHWTDKEKQEHQFVERFIEEVLNGVSYQKEGPVPVAAGPVYHLKSTYNINVHGSPINPFTLHPGPALSGYPVNSAMENLQRIEDSPRRYYTGFLGPVWEKEHSRFFINLRCLEIVQDYNILYAGGGLTIDSDPEAEWIEIQDKLSTLRSQIFKCEETP